MIIGWSLVNNSIENEVFELSKNKIDYFKNEGLITESAKVGLALQWCVDEPYQNKGVVKTMYSSFEYFIKDKYDIIEASIRKSNPAGNAATLKLGMRTIYEDSKRFYRVKETPDNVVNKFESKSLFFDECELIIRQGLLGDENDLFRLNKKWVIENRKGDLSYGFLTSLYSLNDFRKIISAQEIVVAVI